MTAAGIQSASQTTMEGQCVMSGQHQLGVGRFTAEDILWGRNTMSKTLNRYGYCWGNPIQYVDVKGRDPITPQDIQKGFWESLLNTEDQAVDDL